MKNFYDKVLFFLGLVLVGLGVFVFVKSGGLSGHSSTPEVKGTLVGKAYEAVPAPTFKTPDAEWGQDVDQTPPEFVAEGRVYGVFTPPIAWWADGQWSWAPPIPPKPLPPFGLHWVGVKQVPYRIQFNGVTGPDDDLTLIFTDDGEPFNAQKGDTVGSHEIKIIDVVVDSTPDERGMVNKKYKATIEDLKTNETVTLTKGMPIFLPDHDYILLQTEDPFPQQDWRITNDKSTQKLVIDSPDGRPDGQTTFTASDLKLSLDNPSVKVTKEFHFMGKPVRRTKTFPEASDSDSATPTTPPAAPAQ